MLTITNKTKPIPTANKVHNEQLECVENAKHLSVILDKKLKWKTHIDTICKKSNQKRSFLQRHIRACSINAKAKAYTLREEILAGGNFGWWSLSAKSDTNWRN